MSGWKASNLVSQKPIPLGTPTQIELRPGVKVQVTLFDANHCAGAVMFRQSDGLAQRPISDHVQCSRWEVGLFSTREISDQNPGTSPPWLGIHS